jgi:hypothetical protein
MLISKMKPGSVSATALAFVGVAAFMILLLGPVSIIAQESERADGMRFVPDVPGQFNNLTIFADAMGFRIGDSPNPSKCRHYQGLARVDGPDGTPYLLITRSGNEPTDTLPKLACYDDNDPGNLLIVRMGSRDKYGERLRSNRLRKGVFISDTPPPPEDTVVNYLTFNGETTGVMSYGHPGACR